METKTILVEKKNHIAIITLNRPEKYNAINLQMKNELYQVLDELDADSEEEVSIELGKRKSDV